MSVLIVAVPLLLAPPAADPCTTLEPNTLQPSDPTLVFDLPQGETCTEKVKLEVGKDGATNERARLADDTVLGTHGCRGQGVLCLSPGGQALVPERVPERLSPGDAIEVKVVGCEALNSKVSYSIDITKIASADRLFRQDPTSGAAEDDKGAEGVTIERDRLCTDAASIGVLHQSKVKVPSDDALQRLEIAFTSDVSKAEYPNVEAAKTSFSVTVEQGRYFVDLGILVPFVIEGRRRVVAEQGPSSGIRTLSIDHDLPKPSPAVMLNVFPGGRRSGIFSSFSERARCQRSRESYFDCSRTNRRRAAANSVGLQVGLDLDFTDPADAFYLGGLFEPVSGLSFNAGISVRKGQFLAPGRFEGQLVADDTDLAPQERYMVRPYLGVTLSLDIIRAVITYAKDARATKGN